MPICRESKRAERNLAIHHMQHRVETDLFVLVAVAVTSFGEAAYRQLVLLAHSRVRHNVCGKNLLKRRGRHSIEQQHTDGNYCIQARLNKNGYWCICLLHILVHMFVHILVHILMHILVYVPTHILVHMLTHILVHTVSWCISWHISWCISWSGACADS